LPSESGPEYVYFFLGSPPGQREISHSYAVPLVPYEASAGAIGARRVPSAKDDSGASSPHGERFVTSVESAVILNGSALFDVAAISVEVRLVCDSVWWVGDEYVGVCPPLGDL